MQIAIIGAGICGLYLARQLAERGESVTVFEKKEKIGKEICSGLFSARILNFIPECRDLVQNQIDFTRINFPKRTLKVNFSQKFFLIRHEELDRLAGNLAEKAGAKIVLNQNISLLPEGFDRIIGCDGALSDTRRGLGLKDPEFFSGIQGFVAKSDFSNYVETWATESGFIWRIPRGQETEWGIMEKPERAKLVFGDFLRKNNISLGQTRAWLIPQGLIMSADSRIALVGDAAGLCKPWSGGGVIWGLTACDLLLKNFPDFIKYREEARRFFLPKIILSKMAKKIIYFSGRNLPWLMPQSYTIEGDFLI
ncbi:MAG: NAD(P)/FAD-dependent oxidoreductase [bacterium]|nr:NAD(P)/FAD-dependent oxidoreductase [bacterium]